MTVHVELASAERARDSHLMHTFCKEILLEIIDPLLNAFT